ncbi:MAG: hypothetical protein GX962_01270 [Epulopiscium sp.]|nr:hypothetical protein [Candidatus Epulonipiscium sp.]
MDILLLAISISLDSFGIGMSYGLKKIKVKILSFLIIIGISVFFFIASFGIGQFFLLFISTYKMKIIGSLLLIGFGGVLFVQTIWHKHYAQLTNPISIRKWRIKSLNIMIDIIQEPISSDLDQSGSIDSLEALYIGMALALDTVIIGLSASAHSISLGWFILALVIMNTIFLKLGTYVGAKSSIFFSETTLKLLSSSIILILGIIKLF